MKYIQIFFIALLYSCSALEGEQKTNVNDIIKTQEIKRVSKAEIMMQAQQMGKLIIEKINKRQIKSDSCEWVNSSALDSIHKNTEIRITWGFEKSVFSSETEQQLMDAYQYNVENSIASDVAVQEIDGKTILFTAPLDVDCDSLKRTGMWSLKMPVKTIVNNL